MKESKIPKIEKKQKTKVEDTSDANYQSRYNNAVEQVRVSEAFFRQYIETGMDRELFDQLAFAGFSPEEVTELRKAFSDFSEIDKERAYAFPYELRKKNFSYQAKAIHAGEKDLSDFWKPIIENGHKTGRYLGYHASPYDIDPDLKKDVHGKMIDSWQITGTEKDHRDNDTPMAYYSEDYSNIYRKNGGKFLYVISSARAPGSGHRSDNSNHWGRASELSVVQKFDLKAADKFVEEQTKEYFKEKNASDK